ncbi:hypothetical protein ACFV0T_10830 [Streptomyces sp. NPDC059582]|uniref:hypothetical protein n=1 Tax=Streptomyces sp. NPDC059582 TaxID=3346875 RepID=UPI0036AD5A41
MGDSYVTDISGHPACEELLAAWQSSDAIQRKSLVQSIDVPAPIALRSRYQALRDPEGSAGPWNPDLTPEAWVRQLRLETEGDNAVRAGSHNEAFAAVRALLEAETGNRPRLPTVHAHIGLGRIAVAQEDIEAATEHFKKAAAVADDSTYRFGRVQALVSWGYMTLWHHSAKPALEQLQEAADIATALDDPAFQGNAAQHRAGTARGRGHWAEAVELFTESLALYRGIGDLLGMSHALAEPAEAQEECGSAEDALRTWREAVVEVDSYRADHQEEYRRRLRDMYRGSLSAAEKHHSPETLAVVADFLAGHRLVGLLEANNTAMAGNMMDRLKELPIRADRGLLAHRRSTRPDGDRFGAERRQSRIHRLGAFEVRHKTEPRWGESLDDLLAAVYLPPADEGGALLDALPNGCHTLHILLDLVDEDLVRWAWSDAQGRSSMGSASSHGSLRAGTPMEPQPAVLGGRSPRSHLRRAGTDGACRARPPAPRSGPLSRTRQRDRASGLPARDRRHDDDVLVAAPRHPDRGSGLTAPGTRHDAHGGRLWRTGRRIEGLHSSHGAVRHPAPDTGRQDRGTGGRRLLPPERSTMSGLSRTAYDRTELDWNRLRHYAEKVARETRAPRGTRQVVEQSERTRQVKSGLFGLSTRQETYTVDIPRTETDDFWVLQSRSWHKKERGRGRQADEDQSNFSQYCLTVTGGLVVKETSRTDVFPKEGPMFSDTTTSERPMTAEDVMLFDFEALRYYREDKRFTIETDREPDHNRLKHHAKGVGLSLALKRLHQS